MAVVPPVTTADPFESMPSAPASTSTVPPLIVTRTPSSAASPPPATLPSVALSPSSLVVTSTVREDTGYSGLWMLDALQDAGYQNLKYKTVTVLSDPSANVDQKLADLNARDLEHACRIIAGTARSMGVEING